MTKEETLETARETGGKLIPFISQTEDVDVLMVESLQVSQTPDEHSILSIFLNQIQGGKINALFTVPVLMFLVHIYLILFHCNTKINTTQ